jgi:hypothetical protein
VIGGLGIGAHEMDRLVDDLGNTRNALGKNEERAALILRSNQPPQIP